MYISPIGISHTNSASHQMKSAQPAFKGALHTDKVLSLLAKDNVEVIDNFDSHHLTMFIGNMIDKYRKLGVNSAFVKLVKGKAEIEKLLGKDAAKYDTNGKVGLRITITDNSSLEKTNKIYEVKTLLMDKKDFE